MREVNVQTDQELKQAIDALQADDVIIIRNSIDLPSTIFALRIEVPGVRIIGRIEPQIGVEPRPTLRCNVLDWQGPKYTSLFVVRGQGKVHFENLGLSGSYEVRDKTIEAEGRGAIEIKEGGFGEIRNCTFRGWPFHGIRVNSSSIINVVNCDFRFCRQKGFGYGVAVMGGAAEVTHCVFLSCRHAITAQSIPTILTSTYVIHDCHITTTDEEPEHDHVYQAIDVHGSHELHEKQQLFNFDGNRVELAEYDHTRGGGTAGVRFHIFRNIVINEALDIDRSRFQPGVVVRGQPLDYCAIHDNTFIECGVEIPKHCDRKRFYIEGNIFKKRD